jgi:hypothetical protein
LTPMLNVSDIERSVDFYASAHTAARHDSRRHGGQSETTPATGRHA